jgi:hypothetical protein
VTLPRLTNDPLPPYSYVPGQSPHPHSDPAGHGFGRHLPPVVDVDSERWRGCHRYLLGLDLFNHGFYWEAHEAWEAVWNAIGRHGRTATYLKALIQLAVVGVKIRQGMPLSALAHARRAAELLRLVSRDAVEPCFMGLHLHGLTEAAEKLADSPPPGGDGVRDVQVLFSFMLLPANDSGFMPGPERQTLGRERT